MIAADGVFYQLRVVGHLDQRWSACFGDLEVECHEDGTSTLTGLVADQAQLHGILASLRDFGINLISVHPLRSPHRP